MLSYFYMMAIVGFTLYLYRVHGGTDAALTHNLLEQCRYRINIRRCVYRVDKNDCHEYLQQGSTNLFFFSRFSCVLALWPVCL